MPSDGRSEGRWHGRCGPSDVVGGDPGAVVGHDALVDLAGEEPFEAADDVSLRQALAVRRAT